MTQVAKTEDIIKLVSGIITPLFKQEFTMVMPFDLNRHENVGEHSFGVSMLACALAEQIDPTLDTGKVAEYALVQDVAEVYVGDVTVWESDEALLKKSQDNSLAAEQILKDYPLFPWISRKYQEFEKLDTPEKRFVYALDKLYPHIIILIGDHHPVHPSWEAYKRTEEVARAKIEMFPALLPLFDDLCKMFRQSPHFFDGPIPPDERQ
jgi:putative hydrolase of HD superfamily